MFLILWPILTKLKKKYKIRRKHGVNSALIYASRGTLRKFTVRWILIVPKRNAAEMTGFFSSDLKLLKPFSEWSGL
jgi:hypothetical protein